MRLVTFRYANRERIGVQLESQILEMLGKSFDTFGPMGQVLVTPDEIPDAASIDVDEWKHRPDGLAGDREDEGILYVPKAGEILYRLKS